jgi:hypothetical protein
MQTQKINIKEFKTALFDGYSLHLIPSLTTIELFSKSVDSYREYISISSIYLSRFPSVQTQKSWFKELSEIQANEQNYEGDFWHAWN